MSAEDRPVAVIPARHASVRLPGKPLVELDGKPLVQRAYETTAATGLFAEVVVATDAEEIAHVVRAFGGDVEMTSSEHRSGTDRVAEVAKRRARDRVVVNVQGDQPWITRESLEALLGALSGDPGAAMSTVGAPLRREQDLLDPNTVKVVRDGRGRALYFSRAAIGGGLGAGPGALLHHFGLYAFAAGFVQTFAALPSTPLERAERLEQLRALEHGHPITVAEIEVPLLEINTPADLEAARTALFGVR